MKGADESGTQSVPGTQGTTQAHTPWSVREEGFTFHRLCTVRDSRGERVVDGFQHVDLARLIAAAPDLLEAARRKVASMTAIEAHGCAYCDGPGRGCVWEGWAEEEAADAALLAAIAKAEGR